ncbi:hydantoinase/oxoprolinase family protein [Cupriavidus pampae]|uniref:Acetophenone carboxylase gamma subunit n=1 Tax=Cupriavidus pampae TaxID=659251 RepID=A0ABN7Z9H5_9BURK|nr:hydantoinase/oxoprolinase family protein [Cupriavidus pampae]CAG9182612.1 Acetophenone carboxylase gamma subunit [Cupriavidus pampae]
MGYRIGVDIGGSFTDFAVLNEETLQVQALKVFSRPDEPGAEVITGVKTLTERYGIDPAEVTYFTHGTTVGVNAVIQRKGLKLALFTTEGFSDVLELGRLKLPSMFNLLSKRPAPLVPREMVFGIRERLFRDGAVDEPLDLDSVAEALALAKKAGAEGVVVSFLHSYRNAAHEQAACDLIKTLASELPVFSSAKIWPIVREFERTTTAIINGYVQPRVEHYLSSFQKALKLAGVQPEPRVTKSNGGVMTAEQAKRECVQMILSGTASGVIGAAFVAKECDVPECMSLDIGGTSADVALIVNGEPQYGIGEYIGEHQIFIPSVSVTSIGDGGGSIAWVDSLGVLKVGPDSAGSSPGPACFGRGGERPTITDAFAVCGIVGQGEIGFNAVKVDVERARTAVGTLATVLNQTIEETAESIINIAVSGMFAKVSGLVTRFGVDPRSMAMLPFGGAGPMMGALLARELEMTEIIVPLVPGVLSAMGGLIADLKNDFIKTVYEDLEPETVETLQTEYRRLRRTAINWLREEQDYRGEEQYVYTADMRYRGQSYEIEAVIDEKVIEAGDFQALRQAFHDAHEKLYGHSDPEASIQIVNLRLVVSGKTPQPNMPRIAEGTGSPDPVKTVDVWSDGAHRKTPVYRRAQLLANQEFSGPAIVTQDDTTTFVPQHMHVRVDAFGNLRITSSAAQKD